MTDAPDGPAEGEPERGARRGPRVGDSGSPVGSTLSIVLAVLAVVAGFFILRAINDDGGGDADGITPGTSGTEVTGGTSQPTGDTGGVDPSTPTTAAAATPTKTGATVMVANASGIGGSAAAMSTALTTDGYTLGEPGNSNLGAPIAASVVYYVDGDPAALAVATTLGTTMGGVQVLPMPIPPPVDGELGASTVLLMLGTDAAGKTLADIAPAAGAVAPPAAVGATPTSPPS